MGGCEMTIKEKLIQHIQTMPESLQTEVLDFVEYLEAKIQKQDIGWSAFSLTSAMRGMEEEIPPYSDGDLKERFP
jgi:hypothetical protein